jgi:Mn2+/Fe2+ NRAMP family transporter
MGCVTTDHAQRLLYRLGIFGPGLIATNAGNDPGGIATYECHVCY